MTTATTAARRRARANDPVFGYSAAVGASARRRPNHDLQTYIGKQARERENRPAPRDLALVGARSRRRGQITLMHEKNVSPATPASVGAGSGYASATDRSDHIRTVLRTQAEEASNAHFLTDEDRINARREASPEHQAPALITCG